MGWKANLLSLARRTVLIQASSSTISMYVMQNAYLPYKILEGINRVNRNFLWGSTDSVKKMHWVNWKKVTMPKDLRGLGLQTTKGRDTTLLAKLDWRFYAENDAFWVRVLKKKYCTSQRINFKYGARLPSSPIWKGFKRGEGIFHREVKWIPSQGSNLNF